MTERELLKYQMTREETLVWEALVEEILRRCEKVDLMAVYNTNIEDRLRKKEPWGPVLGYSKRDGYYRVEEGDKGSIHILMRTKSKEEAIRAILSDMAHDFSYRYVADNMSEINNIKKKEWDYDTEYDYRKYWFELALYFCEIVMEQADFEAEVRDYEKSLNHHHNPDLWRYDVEKKEFVLR